MQVVKSLLRRGKLGLEKHCSVKLPLNHHIIPWLVMHCAYCHNRFSIGEDGKSPYLRARGKPFDKSMVEFGEKVLVERHKGDRM